jgi:hypothetical protein
MRHLDRRKLVAIFGIVLAALSVAGAIGAWNESSSVRTGNRTAGIDAVSTSVPPEAHGQTIGDLMCAAVAPDALITDVQPVFASSAGGAGDIVITCRKPGQEKPTRLHLRILVEEGD